MAVERLYSTKEAAEKLSLHIRDVQCLIQKGVLPAKRIIIRGRGAGGEGRHRAKPRYRITERSLQAYIDNLAETKSTVAHPSGGKRSSRIHRMPARRRIKAGSVVNIV